MASGLTLGHLHGDRPDHLGVHDEGVVLVPNLGETSVSTGGQTKYKQ